MSASHALTRGLAGAARERRAAPVSRGDGSRLPLVAILCAAPRARAATAAVALALARATGCPCALAGAVGERGGTARAGMPAAGRGALALEGRGLPARASGRLVWLADRRDPLQEDDLPARCAALSAELARAAAALAAPGVVAFPFARTDALDRVLAWHDAIVIVPEPAAPATLNEQALASLERLGRPVAAIAPPTRMTGALAVAGVAPPSEAVRALADLVETGRGGRDA